MVYDLATGNNGVASLAWDHAQNALYAATECYYMDRLGRNHDYRSAKIPKAMRYNPEEGEEDVMDDDDDDEYEGGDDSDEDDEDMCWPQKAYHGEDYFGYAFDAGEHRICEYPYLYRWASLTVFPVFQTDINSRRILTCKHCLLMATRRWAGVTGRTTPRLLLGDVRPIIDYIVLVR